MKTTTKNCVCFAYFGDGQFLGWYADSFGSVRPSSPKIYSDDAEQVEIITGNFRGKMSDLKEKSTLGDKVVGLSILDRSLNEDKTNLSQYKEVELRMVECPYYDGKNPNFDEAKYRAWIEDEKKTCVASGKEFLYSNCPPELNNWIYADYSLVKEWAKTEPTEFVRVIKQS